MTLSSLKLNDASMSCGTVSWRDLQEVFKSSQREISTDAALKMDSVRQYYTQSLGKLNFSYKDVVQFIKNKEPSLVSTNLQREMYDDFLAVAIEVSMINEFRGKEIRRDQPAVSNQ